MLCKKCGKEIDFGSDFCPFCNFKLRETITTADEIFKDGFSIEKLIAEVKRIISEGWCMTFPPTLKELGLKQGGSWRSSHDNSVPEPIVLATFERDC